MGDVAYGWVALLTDYGRRDGFVAACHGVIARIAPDVRVIDITHDVPPQDIRHGAAVLAQTVPYLPPAVIVGVVDPGVGTARRGVALAAGESVLVGPDNGLLCWAAAALGGTKEAVALVGREYHLPARSGTFDGRDVFAPVAAHVARGTPLADLGSRADGLVVLPEPEVNVRVGRVETEVLTVDHFGNIQLAARQSDLDSAELAAGTVAVELNGQTTVAVRGSVFADVRAGGVLLYVDGAGHAAVAVNQGDAASALGARPADRVVLRRAD